MHEPHNEVGNHLVTFDAEEVEGNVAHLSRDTFQSMSDRIDQEAFVGKPNLSGKVTSRGTTYQWVAPNGGAGGIKVTARTRYRDDSGATAYEETVYTAPPTNGRMRTTGGIKYVIPLPDGQSAWQRSGADLTKPANWYDAEADWAEAMEVPAIRKVWFRVACDSQVWPVLSTSPAITEGLPPLIDLGHPTGEEESAKEVWRTVGQRLTPTGRFVMGLALAAPWYGDVTSTSGFVYLVSTIPGNGKSSFLHLAAGMYGHPGDAQRVVPRSLFLNSTATGNAMITRAARLSYLPVILDEIRAAGRAEVFEESMTNLLSGASKARLTRDSSLVDTDATWMGLVLGSGNRELTFTYGAFGRRFLRVSAEDLWAGKPSGQTRKRAWFEDDMVAPVRRNYGWPWAYMKAKYGVGTSDAAIVPEVVADEVDLDLPGEMASMGRLGMWGAQIMGEWCEEPETWTSGLDTAVPALLAQANRVETDPAVLAARAVLDDQAGPGAGSWQRADGGGGFVQDRHGWLFRTDLGRCAKPHDDQCMWSEANAAWFTRTLSALGLSPEGLAGTDLASAFPDHQVRTSRPRIGKDGWERPFVYAMCNRALESIIDESEEQGQVPAPREQEPVQTEALFGAPTPAFNEPAPEPAPEQEPEDPPMDEKVPLPARRVVRFVDLGQGMNLTTDEQYALHERVADELAAAYADGVTELAVTGRGVKPPKVPGWSTGAADKAEKATMTAKDGRMVNLYRVADAEQAEALIDFIDYYPGFITTGMTAQKVLKDAGANMPRTPMWHLPPEQRALWCAKDPKVEKVEVQHSMGAGRTDVDKEKAIELGWAGYDRNLHYLSATAQAHLAPLYRANFEDGEGFVEYGPDAPVDPKKFGGMYEVALPEWDRPGLNPFCDEDPGEVRWCSSELIGYAVNELGLNVDVRRAFLAPVHSMSAFTGFKETVATMMEGLKAEGRPGAAYAKELFHSLYGTFESPAYATQRDLISRYDWGAAIQDYAWVTVHRDSERIRKATGMSAKFAHVDALYYSEPLPEWAIRYEGENPLTDKPRAVIKVGTGRGMYKREV